MNRRLWFRNIASLPDLDDRVWDARLIGDGVEGDRNGNCRLTEVSSPGLRTGENEEGGRERGKRAGMGLVALALAHNSVEVRVQRNLFTGNRLAVADRGSLRYNIFLTSSSQLSGILSTL